MNLSDAEFTECQTEHGLLIAFGEFAQHTGLIPGLMSVRIPQKVQRQVGAVPPQTKLIELSAGLLAGMEYLQDLSLGHHPLAKDQAVAEAWGQARLVHYSNVSRTLEACDETTVQDIRAVIARFNQPFIEFRNPTALRWGARSRGCRGRQAPARRVGSKPHPPLPEASGASRVYWRSHPR